MDIADHFGVGGAEFDGVVGQAPVAEQHAKEIRVERKLAFPELDRPHHRNVVLRVASRIAQVVHELAKRQHAAWLTAKLANG